MTRAAGGRLKGHDEQTLAAHICSFNLGLNTRFNLSISAGPSATEPNTPNYRSNKVCVREIRLQLKLHHSGPGSSSGSGHLDVLKLLVNSLGMYNFQVSLYLQLVFSK